jgi:hypothetical protein
MSLKQEQTLELGGQSFPGTEPKYIQPFSISASPTQRPIFRTSDFPHVCSGNSIWSNFIHSHHPITFVSLICQERIFSIWIFPSQHKFESSIIRRASESKSGVGTTIRINLLTLLKSATERCRRLFYQQAIVTAERQKQPLLWRYLLVTCVQF